MAIIAKYSSGITSVSANSSAAQVFPDAFNSANPAVVLVPSSGRLEQRKFIVRAVGYATTAGSYTVTITLGFKAAIPATPLTLSNWTTLGASSARTYSTTSAPWMIEAELIMDTKSGKVHGAFKAIVNNMLDGSAAISNALTGIVADNTETVEPAFAVCCAITFGTGSASNKGVLGDFIVEAA